MIGKEKALEAVDLSGADIDGGYDIIGEYGVTLSLDPITRREEILSLQPMFQQAGIQPRTLLKLLKLNELEPAFDMLDMAESRQKEIFDRMIATGGLEQPEDLMDHENMIAWALQYFMTQEFQALADETKNNLKQHIRLRIQLAAQEKQGGAAPAAPAGLGAAPGAVPAEASAAGPAAPPVGAETAPAAPAGAI